MSRAAAKAPRQSKTPRQRAQEALGIVERLVKRLTDKKAGLVADLAEVEHELMLATRRRDYLAQSPDLDDDPDQMAIALPEEGDAP